MEIKDNLLPLKCMHSPRRAYSSLSSEQKKYIDKFNEEILKGRIKFETVNCLCSNDRFSLLASVDRYSLLQQTVICNKCGLILSNPRATEEQYKIFYNSDVYRRCYESENFLERYESFYTLSTGKHILETVCKVKKLKEINSVMEFGAGGGWNLIPFKNKGIAVTGYDYSPSLVSLGRKHGLNLIQGGLDDIRGCFDLIILNHVVEHFTDPITYLRKIKKHLNPQGIIYIAVPDMENFGMGQLQNAHTYYFTLPTLQYYMSKSGLKLIYHEPAEAIHLATIFVEDEEILANDFLKGNYEYMVGIIEKCRRRLSNPARKIIVGLLDLIGLKKVAGGFFNFLICLIKQNQSETRK